METYDYIIIGAGSTGCVLANRLSADSAKTVLLIEAGPPDNNLMVQMPGGLLEVFKNGGYHWQLQTVPQKYLNNRKLTLFTGKTLGGSSSVNGLLCIRGSARDYDRWANELGCTGWSYQDVLPYFIATESQSRGANAYRGAKGELSVIDAPEKFPHHQLVDAFVQSAIANGIPKCDDFCGPDPEGAGYTQATIYKGKRESTATAFLNPVKSRSNLKILTNALVEKIQIDRDVAVAVTVSHEGQTKTFQAKNEIILSAGALRSPQILNLSGIGDQEILSEQNIDVVRHLPGVGQNLHDHPRVGMQFNIKKPISLSGLSKLTQLKIALNWFIFKKGIASWNNFDGNIFTRSQPDLSEPDVQIQLVPLLALGLIEGVGQRQGITYTMCGLSERSRGTVRLRSNNPLDQPLVDLNFMANEADLIPLREGFRICRTLMKSDVWKDLIGEEIAPGANVATDAALDDYLRANIDTDYHYGGTCKMGAIDDPLSVVDPQLRVKGIKNLRVADASIMPLPLHGNTNVPCVMIGAKLADKILKP